MSQLASSMSPCEYCGYMASTYCSTYWRSLGVIGPDHRRSSPCSVEIASAMMCGGMNSRGHTFCEFFCPELRDSVSIISL